MLQAPIPLRCHNYYIPLMSRTTLPRSVRIEAATTLCPHMPSSNLQVRLLAFKSAHPHWRAGIVDVPSLSAPMTITMAPYDGRGSPWSLRQAVTGRGRPKVVHFMTSSFPASAYMNDNQ